MKRRKLLGAMAIAPVTLAGQRLSATARQAGDDVKAIAVGFFEAFNQALEGNDPTTFDAVVAEDFRDLSLDEQTVGPGLVGVKAGVERITAAFPDLRYTVQDVLVSSNRAAVRVTAATTHQGMFAGFQPTGASVSWSEISIFEITDGLIVARWGITDTLRLLDQLEEAQPLPE